GKGASCQQQSVMTRKDCCPWASLHLWFGNDGKSHPLDERFSGRFAAVRVGMEDGRHGSRASTPRGGKRCSPERRIGEQRGTWPSRVLNPQSPRRHLLAARRKPEARAIQCPCCSLWREWLCPSPYDELGADPTSDSPTDPAPEEAAVAWFGCLGR